MPEHVVGSTESFLLWGLLFGSLGIGYMVYGRRQRNMVAFFAGIALMAFPYFVSGTLTLLGTGIVLLLMPFFIRL